MVFGRLFRQKRAPSGHVGCFGKLPFHEEYLRVGIDSQAGEKLFELVEEAHAQIVATQAPRHRNCTVRLLLSMADQQQAAFVVLRPSQDAKGRHFPICAFTIQDLGSLSPSSHLAPLVAQPIWTQLALAIFERTYQSPQALAEGLRSIALPVPDVQAAAQQFGSVTSMVREDPWQWLVGGGAERAAACARKLAQVRAMLHDDTALSSYTLALRIPASPPTSGTLTVEPVRAAAWAKLLSTALTLTRPWAAVIEVDQPEVSSGVDLAFFDRPVESADLAWALAGSENAPVDDLTTPWQSTVLDAPGEAWAGNLARPEARPLTTLWQDDLR